MNEKSFKLCLTMAGAVSAGAYTAGVIDELFHVLDLWEQQKQSNKKLGKKHPDYDHSLPMHRVSLTVMSGASAGGITAALSLQKLLDTRYQNMNDHPVLKDCWVNMADDARSNTFEKLLDKGDLKPGKTPDALLNGIPITALAETHFKQLESTRRPPWVSKNAEIILTTTNLDGIPVEIKFNQADRNGNGHLITQHSSIYRFKLAAKKQEQDEPADQKKEPNYYPLDLRRKKDLDHLKNAALSTSAFPIGLPARTIELPHKPYVKFTEIEKEGSPLHFEYKDAENRCFSTVDGGLLNNEPYGWGIKLLQEKCPKACKKNRYAVIMIDPLPVKNDHPQKTTGKGIINIAKGMFRALRNEVMLNQEGIAEAIAMKDRTRFLIAPKKGGENTSKHVLASSPVFGFAGFIDKERRHHDYELGRRNCRDFLRFYLTLPVKKVPARLGFDPSKDVIKRFGINPDKDKKVAEDPHLPVIPDIRLKKARTNTPQEAFPESNTYPDYPVFNMENFKENYQKSINKRLNGLVLHTTKKYWQMLAFQLLFRKKLRIRLYHLIKSELQ